MRLFRRSALHAVDSFKSGSISGLVFFLCLAGLFSVENRAQAVPPSRVQVRMPASAAFAQSKRTAQTGGRATPADASLPQAAAPQFSVAAGSYSSAQTVTITDSTPGATIYYTTNGTYPWNASWYAYAGPITVSSSEIVVAVAYATGYNRSDWASAEYLITTVPTRFTYTIAGSDTWGYSGDGGPAAASQINQAEFAVADSSGNVYIADTFNNVVRKVDAKTGNISTIAGTGEPSDTGNNGPAASATLWWPTYLALDGSGNLFIGETGDHVVRKLNLSTGKISAYAGSPNGTASSGPAISLGLADMIGMATDPAGDLFISLGYSILEVDVSTGNATQYAGYGVTTGFNYLEAFTIDNRGNIFGWEAGYGVIDKITPNGTVTIFAGTKSGGGAINGGDGGPATQARLGIYGGFLATDATGNLYIADSLDYAIREVDAQSGIINTVAGIYLNNYTVGGDGDPSTSSAFTYPGPISVDAAGNIYMAEEITSRIRKITAPALPPSSATAAPAYSLSSGSYANAQTLAITSTTPGAAIYVTFDGSAPTTNMQAYHGPIDVTGSAQFQALAVAPGFLKSSISSQSYTVTAPPDAIISTVAGSGKFGFSGSGGPATSAQLGYPWAVALDASGNFYIADRNDNVVWKVAAASSTISIVAGNGTYGFAGDGGAATQAEFSNPYAVAVDKGGNLYIADSGNARVRVVNAATGIITTFAGGGQPASGLGDGGPAAEAKLGDVQGLAFDSSWNLYIADSSNDRIREVNATTGVISTVAGGVGTNGPLGDGGAATSASMWPISIALDKQNNLYLVDAQNARVRKIESGIITTVAGGGNPGPDADGLLAADIGIIPNGVGVDASGNVYYSDRSSRVRKVDASTGIVTTVAGNTYYGNGRDGGPATMASLSSPRQIAFDNAGNLYIADAASVVRKVVFLLPAAAPSFSVPGGSYTSVQRVTLTDSTAGAKIYYTTDGTTPDTSSTLYSGPITVRESETLQSVAAANGHAISAVAKASYTITLQTPTVALSSSAATAFTSNAVTFTATMTTAGGSPTGTISFMDGSSELGTGTLASGVATYTTSSLTAGTHSITAVYAGDDSFNSVTSAVVTETIVDFTFAPPSGGSTSATVQPGATATYSLAITPPAGTTTPTAVTFSVSGLPAGATATFTPSSVPANSGATKVTLSVAVPAQSAAVPSSSSRFPVALGLLALPLLAFRKKTRAALRIWLFAALVISASAGVAVTGCGGGSNNSGGGGGGQPQTYNLTVTATAGSLSHTTKLTLTVQ